MTLFPVSNAPYLFTYLLIRKSKQLCQGQALTGITVDYSIKINFERSPVHTKDKSIDNNYSSKCCSKSV
jgi:hypothetical protein